MKTAILSCILSPCKNEGEDLDMIAPRLCLYTKKSHFLWVFGHVGVLTLGRSHFQKLGKTLRCESTYHKNSPQELLAKKDHDRILAFDQFTEICNFEVNAIILFAALPLYYSQTSCGGSLSKWPGLKKLPTGQALSITALFKNNTIFYLFFCRCF